MEGQLTEADIEGELFDAAVYREAVGSLMYLSDGSCPEISFPVNRLAQYVETPTIQLWARVKRILRYISGTRNEGMCYRGDRFLCSLGFSDSDWGGCKINRKSTQCYAFIMDGGALS